MVWIALRRLKAILIVCILSVLWTSPLRAQSPEVEIAGPIAPTDLHGHVDYFLDEDGALGIDDILSTGIAGRFAPLGARDPDFGYSSSKVWLRFAVRNASAETVDWLILFKENFMQEFDVFQVFEDGGIVWLMSETTDSTFSSRPVSYPLLVAPFELQPGQSARIFARYRSGGSTSLVFNIETVQSFADYADGRTALHFVFYGMMTILVGVGLVAFLISRNPIFATYSGYATFGLLFIMHGDGNAFKYVWPNAPWFNSSASLYTGAGIIITGGIFSILFLQTRRYHPVLHSFLLSIVGIGLLMLCSSAIADHQPLKKLFVLYAFFAVSVYVVAGFVAARTRFKQVRFYVLAWCGVTVSSAILVAQHWFGWFGSDDFQLDSMRAVMVFDAFFMGLALWDSFNQMRQSRHQALQSSLKQAQRNLELNQRMEDLEQRYEMAQRLADSHGERLADTIHDLSQPLQALRLNVRALATGQARPNEISARIEDTFSYLENLVTDHLQRSTLVSADGEPESSSEQTSELELGDVLAGIAEMFASDAAEKGLRFRHMPTGLRTRVDAMALMRIVSNLVSNAIKYTQTGGVLLGCRRTADALRVEVHDTGPGMSAEQFADARMRAQRLDRDDARSPGHGLGLDIACALAEEHGWSVSRLDTRKSGTGLALTIPLANSTSNGDAAEPETLA